MPMARRKLTEEESKDYRDRLPRNSYKRIAEIIGRSKETVRQILLGHSWDNYGVIPIADKIIEEWEAEVERKVNEV